MQRDIRMHMPRSSRAIIFQRFELQQAAAKLHHSAHVRNAERLMLADAVD
jgi:hypothetical protein